MDLSNARWRKSSRSGASGGNCVEVASNLPGAVAVRDSKDIAGPSLTFAPAAWAAFVSQLAKRPLTTQAYRSN
ncbi:DUF397 domain-containing protein [Micromonospora sp. NPDC047762]|uniref:DUF397 domain-containing protein n=1 Tax=Micromonospora sp. NPDC047762 TaxID=3364255 RepID=UPI0037227925